jgi:dephospho-CoA kinase
MIQKRIIGLIGEKGSGKGTVSKYLEEKYAAKHYGTSKILKRTIDDLHLAHTRENYIKLALVLKEGYWPSVVIDALIADIENNGNGIIIADGIRMHGDVRPFREKYGDNFQLIYVTADPRIRYERTKQRKEKDGEDKVTFENFLAQEAQLTEISIHEIGTSQADFVIHNDKTYDDLVTQIEGVMKQIMDR